MSQTPLTDAYLASRCKGENKQSWVEFARGLEERIALQAEDQRLCREGLWLCSEAEDMAKQLDAVAKELGLPAEARKIAGCDVLAHYIRDLRINFERVSGQLNDLISLCHKQGLEITMISCAPK